MPSNSAMTFDLFRVEVESMLASGEPFSAVEETINASTLGEYQKAALWLLAWSSQPAESLRENLRATLALAVGEQDRLRTPDGHVERGRNGSDTSSTGARTSRGRAGFLGNVGVHLMVGAEPM